MFNAETTLRPKRFKPASDSLKQDIAQRLIEQLIDVKYKALFKVWDEALQGKPIDWIQYSKTMNRVSHSYVTRSIEDQLTWFKDGEWTLRYNVNTFIRKGNDCLDAPNCSQRFTHDRFV